MEKPLQPTVLVVDDEASVRTYVKTVLQHEDFQVLEAADGLDALALLQGLGRAVDLLVTDVRMPRMKGTDLVRAVRSGYPNIPVVYISGEHLNELHNPLRRTVFLQKPFAPQILLNTVRDMLPESARASGSTI